MLQISKSSTTTFSRAVAVVVVLVVVVMKHTICVERSRAYDGAAMKVNQDGG